MSLLESEIITAELNVYRSATPHVCCMVLPVYNIAIMNFAVRNVKEFWHISGLNRSCGPNDLRLLTFDPSIT